MRKSMLKLTAHTLILALAYELAFPVCAYALTSGPSQPEVQSFEPVGTTEMVNMFTGDFVYNLPLLDVEGYPVNISYHSGVGVEDEASWVGLGWNINPGEINRTVRGLPDDFNGDKIEKELNIKEEVNIRVGVGTGMSTELMGVQMGMTYSMYANFNNYKGVSAGFAGSTSLSWQGFSVGINMGIGSQTGADADLNVSAGYSTSRSVSKDAGAGAGFSVSGGTGFNSRSGLKGLSFSANAYGTATGNRKNPTINTKNEKVFTHGKTISGPTANTSIPIGLQNYVPVISNQNHLSTVQFQIKGGGEIFFAYPSAYLNAMISRMTTERNGSKGGYGYLYLENATKDGIMDFSRDKDGIYNKTLPNLPLSSMTYDIYSVSGHGTGGMFRPFRNDVGTIYDPEVRSSSEGDDMLLEFGAGNLFEIGVDVNIYDNKSYSGPWNVKPFGTSESGSLYEKLYFKQAGELTYNNQQNATTLFSATPSYVKEDMTTLIGKGTGAIGSLPTKMGNANDRTTRANLLTYKTAELADYDDVLQSSKVLSYVSNSSGNTRHFDPLVQKHDRYGATNISSQKHHVTEFAQTLPDGKRYVYGLPVINHASREVTFNVNESNANLTNGTIPFNTGDDTKDNNEGRENFYSSSVTPTHATSYLLTSILSTDYADLLGDGPTDDDPGTYVKFNYTLLNNDYRWRSPYPSNLAQYNPGFAADSKDGKGFYLTGSRQQWHLRAIESKNQIAEFYISERADGKGSSGAVLPGNSSLSTPSGLNLKSSTTAAKSYKLDSIKLFNKQDRYLNENNAVPVKTVIFDYNYSLCPGTPNSDSSGKLTLKRIYVKYGNSEKSLLSPYVFHYNGPNPAYDFAAKDRWGTYKTNHTARSNYEFPYTSQGTTDSAAAYNLTDIRLPSGGKIHISYEPDDYSFVQDRRSMQMFDVVGLGSSPKFEQKNVLYEDESTIYDYVYFKRRKQQELSHLSPKENYLEDQDLLYYSFNLDITGTGKYEYIKGYAKIDEVGFCPGDTLYGYVKLKRDNVKGMWLHPATIYGLNIARYYLPHVLYKGFEGNSDYEKVLLGLIEAAGELKTIWQNPFKRYIREKKAQNVRLAKSWLRLQVPGLTKKGGGIRVKELTLSDNWQNMSGSQPEGSYGRTYDYTIDDARYGIISSGVASYEPIVGGDENPFRRPVPYTADGGRLLPAIEFFQEEPYGETFFPSPVVGYSSVRMRSIHVEEGRSSQTEEEHLFYTAKDFPVEIDFTPKDAPGAVKRSSLRSKYQEEEVLQGYALRLNDMHGKPKSVSNYVMKTDALTPKKELVTATRYYYQQDGSGRLNNEVNALLRTRGSQSNYAVQKIILGQEIDYTIDSRKRQSRSYNRNIAANLNVVLFGIFTVPIPTLFLPDKEDEQIFKMMVSTKIVQQYGILQKIEHVDHGAVTTVENLIYDSETGQVLLSAVNNEYNDKNYTLSYPAYLAYSGMGAAYMNDGYEEIADSLIYDYSKYDIAPTPAGQPPAPPVGVGERRYYLYPKHREYFHIGDELLIEVPVLTAPGVARVKAWISDIYSDPYLNVPDPTSVPSCILNGPQTCRIEIALRNEVDNGVRNLIWPTSEGYTKQSVRVKVLRSGRRNHLTQNVQTATLAQNPYNTSINDLFGNTSANGNAFDKLISITAGTFSDTAQPFGAGSGSFADTIWAYNSGSYTSSYKSGFNPFVNGRRGNFQVFEQYVNLSKRAYAKTHIRHDGVFPIRQAFWNFSNGHFDACALSSRVLSKNSISQEYWKRGPQVTRRDPFGNVHEELDAIGNYAAAQWGYNKALPVSTAVNVQQKYFFFDGFEEQTLLHPEASNTMYRNSGYYLSPFTQLFGGTMQLIASAGYTNSNTISNSYILSRYGQSYHIPMHTSPVLSGLTLTSATYHSGRHSLKVTSAQSVPISVSDALSEVPFYYNSNLCRSFDVRAIKSFQLQRGRKYVYNCWVKPFSSGTSLNNLMFVNINGSNLPLTPKSGNIDGWYLMEAVIDLKPYTNPSTTLNVSLSLPANVYVDDVRMVPVDAGMKSFVYDPFTFRLSAQLDENHYTSFYEYDQEGLLVRVKKETDKGVVTISEHRRANAKKP